MTDIRKPLKNQEAKPYWILIFLSFGIFIAADDLTVVSTLLPQIIIDLEIPVPSGLDDAAWIVTAYLIANIVAMPLLGKLSDLAGRMKVYIGSMVIFMLGSLGVSLADDLSWLIAFRVIQAVGSGAMFPVSMALIGDVFPRGKRGMAMGVLGAIDTLGWIFGPLYGAFLVSHFNWRWQFYLNIPASILAIASAYLVLRKLDFPRSEKKLDIIGTMLFSLGLITLNLGLSYIGGQTASGISLDFQPSSINNHKVIAALIMSLGLFIGFFLWEKRVKDPIIDLSMFRTPNFFAASLTNFFVGFALITAMVNVPLFINTILTRGNTIDEIVRNAATDSGMLLAVMTASMAVFSLVGGWLTKTFSYRVPTMAGLGICAFGFFQMGQWSVDVTQNIMRPQLFLVGVGFGLLMAPLSTAVVNAVNQFQRGIASSLTMIFRMVGMSVGLSAITAWSLKRFYSLSQNYSLSELYTILPTINAKVYNETFLIGSLALVIAFVPCLQLKNEKISKEVQ